VHQLSTRMLTNWDHVVTLNSQVNVNHVNNVLVMVLVHADEDQE
jgi:hypothetical protein